MLTSTDQLSSVHMWALMITNRLRPLLTFVLDSLAVAAL